MQATVSENPLLQDCLGKLERLLALSMETAEAASAEGNHKLVLQAIREGTRIVTLIFKMTSTPRADNCQAVPSLLPYAMLAAVLPPADPTPTTNGSLSRQREKNGKWAGKISPSAHISELDQTDAQRQKSAGENASPCRPSGGTNILPTQVPDFSAPLPGNWVQELDSGRLDVNVLHAIGAGRPFPENLGLFKTSAGPAHRPGLVGGEAPETL